MRTVEEEVGWVTKWISRQLDDMRAITYTPFQVLLMITIIEGFAQQGANYQKDQNAKHFANFVLEYSGTSRDVLNEVCPVTLYYHYKDKFGFDQLKLQYSRIYSAGDLDLAVEASRLCCYLPAEKLNDLSRHHKYAYLIYALRNKVVHELNYINSPMNFQEEKKLQVPHIAMRSKIELDEKSGETRLVFDAWTLHIPVQFVERILNETTTNYLKKCIDDQKMPFGNHSEERKCQLAWYD